jgi:hypothetical protein
MSRPCRIKEQLMGLSVREHVLADEFFTARIFPCRVKRNYAIIPSQNFLYFIVILC